jgi:hypothetical protein
MIQGSRLSALAAAALVIALPWLASGCGSKSHSSFGGVNPARKPNQYKAQDTELVQASNKIPVYSSPDNARRAMKRQPDQTVSEENGVITQYYNSDDTANAERLRLRYSNNRLIGKEILPPDPNTGSSNGVQVYGSNNVGGTFNATPADNANSKFNNDFNSKLNTTANRR